MENMHFLYLKMGYLLFKKNIIFSDYDTKDNFYFFFFFFFFFEFTNIKLLLRNL